METDIHRGSSAVSKALGRLRDEVEVWLRPDHNLVSELRRRTLDTMSGWGLGAATTADAIVCVDRLGRTAAKNTCDRVGLSIAMRNGNVRVCVRVRCTGVDHRVAWRSPTGEDELGEVGSLAARWGGFCECDVSTMWFELALPLTDRQSGAEEVQPRDAGVMAELVRAPAVAHRFNDFGGPTTELTRTAKTKTPSHAAVADSREVLVHGRLRINLITRSAQVDRDGKIVRLTGREFELLMHLIRHQGAIQSRRDLLRAVWGIDFDADTAVVEVTISRLRRKLNIAELKTIKDMGYVFGEPSERTRDGLVTTMSG